MEENNTPKLPKLPFIAVDVVLVIAAIFIANSGEGPLSPFNFFWVIFCIALGGVLACLPFYVEFRNHMRLAEYDKSQSNYENSRRIEAAQAEIQQICEAITQQVDRSERTGSVIEHLAQALDSKIQSLDLKVEEIQKAETTTEVSSEESSKQFDDKLVQFSQQILRKLDDNRDVDLSELKSLIETNETATLAILAKVSAISENQEDSISPPSKEALEVVSDEFETIPMSASFNDELNDAEDGVVSEEESESIEIVEESETLEAVEDFAEDIAAVDEDEDLPPEEQEVTASVQDIEEESLEVVNEPEALEDLDDISDGISISTEEDLSSEQDEDKLNETIEGESSPVLEDDKSTEAINEPEALEDLNGTSQDSEDDALPSEQDETASEDPVDESNVEEKIESVEVVSEFDDDFDAFSEDISMSVEADLAVEEENESVTDDIVAEEAELKESVESLESEDEQSQSLDDTDFDLPSESEPNEDGGPISFLPEDDEDETESTEAMAEEEESEAKEDSDIPETDNDLKDQELAEEGDSMVSPAAHDQPDLMVDIPEGSAKAKKSGRKETALVAQVLIGIGNKPYVRGEGPGLSEDIGVPMDFLEIGKWQWIAPESSEPVICRVYKNDEIEAEDEPVVIEPGQKRIISPRFPG